MTERQKRLKDKLKSVKALVSSVSGVLNNNNDIIGLVDGKIFMGFERSHYDGQGASLLRAIGLNVAFIHVDPYNPNDPISKIIERWNSLPSAMKPDGWPSVKLISGVIGAGQIGPVTNWLNKELGLTYTECVVVGHDLVQIPLMRVAKENGAFIIAPAQAEDVAKELADYVTIRSGGNGALRDIANLILEAKEIDPTVLPTR